MKKIYFLGILWLLGANLSYSQMLSAEDQNHHVEWLEKTLEAQYALYYPKKSLISRELNSLKNQIEGRTHYQKFYEKIRRTLASMDDVHLQIRPNYELPFIYLGIEFTLIRDEIYVLNSSDSNIPSESQLLTLDGVSALSYLDSLANYCFGSTQKGKRALAVNRLNDRNFLLPKQTAFQELSLLTKSKDSIKVKVPIHWINKKYSLEYAESDFLKLQLSEKRPSVHQHFRADNMGLVQLSEYSNAHVFLRTGYYPWNDQRIAVIQFNEFTETAFEENGKNTFEILRDFVQEAKNKELDILIDLRYNEGGNGNVAMELISLLIPTGSRAYPTIRSHPVNYESYTMLGSVNEDGSQVAKAQRSIINRWDSLKNLPLTPFYHEWEHIESDSEYGGFDGTLFLLSGPLSISTSDMFINMLKTNQPQVRLIGQAAHGSGSGYIGMNEHYWQPSRSDDGLFTYSIPNKIVGRPIKKEAGLISYEEYLTKGRAEGKPHPVDWEYTFTDRDVFQKHENFWDWFLNTIITN